MQLSFKLHNEDVSLLSPVTGVVSTEFYGG